MESIYLITCIAALAYCQEFSSVDCDFNSSLCGWEAELPWKLSEIIFLPNALNLNPLMLTGDGAFVSAQGYFGSNTTADLISPLMQPSAVLGIFSFKYTKMVGNAILEVIIKEGPSYRILDTISSNSPVLWMRRTLVVPTSMEPYQIVLRVSKLRNGFDTISIDDVLLRTTARTVMSADISVKPGQSNSLVEMHELRRSPAALSRGGIGDKQLDTTPRCKIKCAFKTNACSWSYTNWKLLRGKIITEAQQDAWLISEPVLLPMNAHFELDVAMSGAPSLVQNINTGILHNCNKAPVIAIFPHSSESSVFSVYQKFGAEESLIWTQSGVTLAGWNRVRLPLRFSSLPSKFLIRTSTRQGQSVAVTNTSIVDISGRDLACGGDLQVIRPRNDDLIRLTAIQKLDSTTTEESTVPALFIVPTTRTPPSVQAPNMRSSSFSLSTDPVLMSQSPFATLPILPAKVSSTKQQGSPLTFINHSSIFNARATASTAAAQKPLWSTTTLPAPVMAFAKKASLVQELINNLAEQPILREQMNYFAKKYGFEEMSMDQLSRRLPQFQRILANLKSAERLPSKQPIQPVNFVAAVKRL